MLDVTCSMQSMRIKLYVSVLIIPKSVTEHSPCHQNDTSEEVLPHNFCMHFSNLFLHTYTSNVPLL